MALAVAGQVPWRLLLDSYTLTNLVIGLSLLGSGAVISWSRPGHVIGTLFQAGGLGHLTTAAAAMLGLFASAAGWPAPAVRGLAAIAQGAWQIGVTGLFPLALLLFPNGRLPSPRWRPVAWVIVASGLYQLVTGVLSDGSPIPGANSLLSVGLRVPEPVDTAAGLVNLALWLAVIGSLVVRYRRGDERTRRQLLWLILALLAVLVVNSQRYVTGDGPIPLLLSFVLFPAAVGIAIVRHGLLDIRLVLSRALLYGLALSAVIAAYAGIVAGLSLLVPADADRGVSIAAAIVVAIGFTPVRLAFQRLIDRALYGLRSEPWTAAARIGERLRHDDDLAGALDRTRTALRLPWLALHGLPEPVSSGTPATEHVELPLLYRGQSVGTLAVGLRAGEHTLHAADRRTLDLIATPLAVALHATALSRQVSQARTAVVEAAAVERVRLQRELHDGLGPALTSIAYLADAASNLTRTDLDTAEGLLAEIRRDLRAALDTVRNVVYGLRPIELDDLGLVEALRQRAGQGRISVEIDAQESLPELSAAVELAAYRIASEALANVQRHSTASTCVITLTACPDLTITVRDDGAPPPSWQPGVGLRSLVERAEEVGGRASAGPTPNGWQVTATLPL